VIRETGHRGARSVRSGDLLVVQSFLKIPALNRLAPGNEPPFAVAQGAVLLLFVALGFLAVRHFHPEEAGTVAVATG
jgi:hypothetical protein